MQAETDGEGDASSQSDGNAQTFFSVVIPTYNRMDIVPNAIASVLAQSFSDFEIVVVDDGSIDETASSVARFSDERLHYVRQANRGLSAARNTGAGAAVGRYLTFLDDDDVARPDWLATLRDLIVTRACAVAWCAAVIHIPGASERTVVPADMGPVFDYCLGIPVAGSFAVQRDLFAECGGFTEGLASSEVSEFLMRALPVCTDHDWVVAASDVVGIEINQQDSSSRPLRSPGPLIDAMQFILERHAARLARSRRYLANCLGILGTSLARMGRLRDARRYLWSALRIDPLRPRNHARFVASLLPPLARRLWR